MSAALACPNCQEATNVAAVEAVLQGETRHVLNYPYGGTNESPLIAMLARPTEPTLETVNGGYPGILGCALGYAVAWLAVGVVVVIANILYRLDATRQAYISAVSSFNAYYAYFGVIVFTVVFAVGGARWMSWARRKQSEAQKAAIQARNQAKTQAWKRAVARWDQSWYCRRCGHVYVPGESRSVPAKQMSELLYQ